MPLYEYECTACHRHTEKIQKFSDPELTQCPHCGAPLSRVLSAPAFSLKGGGWYADGYGSRKPAASGSNEGAPASDSAPAAAAATPAASTPATSSGGNSSGSTASSNSGSGNSGSNSSGSGNSGSNSSGGGSSGNSGSGSSGSSSGSGGSQ